jgi:hypothetical protein
MGKFMISRTTRRALVIIVLPISISVAVAIRLFKGFRATFRDAWNQALDEIDSAKDYWRE